MATQQPGPQPTRRSLLRTGLAATTIGALSALGAAGTPVRGSDFPSYAPPSNGSPLYDAALKAKGGMKAVFQSPAIDARFVDGDTVNHLLLLQLKNWLNSFELAYDLEPADLHTIVATYASANVLTYGDAIWRKYRLGERYEITDPVTGKPATRNVFWPRQAGAGASSDPTTSEDSYQDAGIDALQQRGTVFLTCTNSLMGHAAAAVADGRAPKGASAADVAADIRGNLVPNAVIVPAVVGEVTRAQQLGYTLVFIPAFTL